MEKLILVHGWGGNPNSEPWFGSLKHQCKEKGIEFIAPAMPNTENPKMNEWISKLKEYSKDLDEQTYFVGHSMGCQTIIRYLSEIPNDVKVGNIVFVAPWIKLNMESIKEEGEESVKIAESWMNVPIRFDEANRHLTNVLAIFSDNDDWVPLSESETFKKRLGAEIIIKKGEGHFNKKKELKEIMEFLE